MKPTQPKTEKSALPVLQVNENVSLEEQIAQRAHELWQHRGREPGHDLTDWLRAECEINEWHQQRCRAQASNSSKIGMTELGK